jgi:alkylation response protein AidB-like acyl-CoA dehydrogenase
VDFAFSEEQQMLRGAAKQWLADRYSTEKVATLADSDAGWDPAVWKELTNLGWLDPELGMEEHAVLAEETGYALLPAPWLSTVGLAGPAYGEAPPGRPATLAWLDDGASSLRDAALSVACRADEEVDGWRLTGGKRAVPDASLAEEAVVVARSGGGVALFRLDLAAHPETVHSLSTMDGTRRLAELRLDGTPAELLVDPANAPAVLAAIRRRSLALLACEAVGVTQRALDIAIEHVKVRTQFDRPIGSYQGVSHRLANVYMALELARSLAYRAAWAVAADASDVDEAVASATVSAGRAAVFGCENAIQAMGGIGFTWDHPLHRFYKRAQWIEGFEGFGKAHRTDLAALIFG